MRINRDKRGFTMAEMLIVIAIIAILAGVSFIAVNSYLRSMAQLERDSIAKEIFVAAQNHLTMVDNQGLLNLNPGHSASTNEDIDLENSNNREFYFAYNTDNYSASEQAQTVLDAMLPFGSIDETIRIGGNYIIHYQTKPALVLDVFYCPVSNGRYLYTLTKNDYTGVMNVKGDDKKEKRKFWNNGKSVLGWYGGADASTGEPLQKPTIKVINREMLIVSIQDDNENDTLRLFIKGETSGALAYIDLKNYSSDLLINTRNRVFRNSSDGSISVIIDDITNPNRHFKDLNEESQRDDVADDATVGGIYRKQGTEFIPGENIRVYAEVSKTNELTSNVSSNSSVTNSLFASIKSDGTTAYIKNIRHLENLDDNVSNVKYDGENIRITKAEQTTDLSENESDDLSWDGFKAAIKDFDREIETVSIFDCDGESTNSENESYHPVSPSYPLDYNGKTHTISNIDVVITGDASDIDAGLFGALKENSSVSDLALIDFNINTENGDAGALVGRIEKGTITNIVAYHTGDSTPSPGGTANLLKHVVSTKVGGSAGGLVGSASNSSIIKSIASLRVEGDGNAGGLIGKTTGGSINASFSGGHTINAAYSSTEYNVKSASGYAGGLVGAAGNTIINYSYSTCSASGKTAGGFVGSFDGTIQYCYTTGLVKGNTTEGAFAGVAGTGARLKECNYFDIINEREAESGNGFTSLSIIGNGEDNIDKTQIEAIDETASSYNEFSGDPEDWIDAIVYDAKLEEYYGDESGARYNMKPIKELVRNQPDAIEINDEDFVTLHYGDWPAPEIFVINTPASSGS